MGKEKDFDEAEETRQATVEGLKEIYIIVAGLAIAEALSRALTDTNGFLGERLIDAPHSIATLLLISFLFTIVRFCHGSLIHFYALTNDKLWVWDMVGLLLQSLLFFVLALTIGNTLNFLVVFILILLVDIFWLFVRKKNGVFKDMHKQWLESDIILFVLFFVTIGLRNKYDVSELTVACIVLAIAVPAAIIDYWKNRLAYFPRKSTEQA